MITVAVGESVDIPHRAGVSFCLLSAIFLLLGPADGARDRAARNGISFEWSNFLLAHEVVVGLWMARPNGLGCRLGHLRWGRGIAGVGGLLLSLLTKVDCISLI